MIGRVISESEEGKAEWNFLRICCCVGCSDMVSVLMSWKGTERGTQEDAEEETKCLSSTLDIGANVERVKGEGATEERQRMRLVRNK
jgi:hypothetical protein